MIGTAFSLLSRNLTPALIVLAGLVGAMIASLVLMPFFGLLGSLFSLVVYAALADYWFRTVHGRVAPGDGAARVLYMVWTLIKIHLVMYTPPVLVLMIAFGRMFFIDPDQLGDATLGVFLMGLMHGAMWLVLLLPVWIWFYLRFSLALAASALEGRTSLRAAWVRSRGNGSALVLPALAIVGLGVVSFPLMMLTGPVLVPGILGVATLSLTSALYMRAGASASLQP